MVHLLDLVIRSILIATFAFFFSITLVVIGDEFGLLPAFLFFLVIAAAAYWFFVQTIVKRY